MNRFKGGMRSDDGDWDLNPGIQPGRKSVVKGGRTSRGKVRAKNQPLVGEGHKKVFNEDRLGTDDIY